VTLAILETSFVFGKNGSMAIRENNIYLIESENRQELAETFMRFQEYYESPVFKGRFFSVHEFENWYASKYGRFSYAKDWSGFNIPSWVLEPFKTGDFGLLTDKEERLLNMLKNQDGKFYIIGATPRDEWFKDTVKHEFVHGAYFTNSNYKKEVDNLIKVKKPEAVKKALIQMGYDTEVLNDETNAYLLTEPETLAKQVSLGDGINFRDKLDKIFKKYFGFSMVKTDVHDLRRRVKLISI
jgi:hypothetical protein